MEDEARKRHHHKKHKKHKHKEKDRDKRRETAERDQEVGSDVESGEIRSDGDGDLDHLAGPRQRDDRRTDPSVVAHRAAGASPAAVSDKSDPARRGRWDPAEDGSPGGAAGGHEEHAGSRKRERTDAEDRALADVSKDGSRGHKEPRHGGGEDLEERKWAGRGDERQRGDRRRANDDLRERDRDRERERPDDRERMRDRDRAREPSVGADREDRRDRGDRERDRDRDRNRGRERDRERDRGLERDRDRERDHDRYKDRERSARPEGTDRRPSRDSRSPRRRADGVRRDDARRRSRSRSPNRVPADNRRGRDGRARPDRDDDRRGRGADPRQPTAGDKSPEEHDAVALALDDDMEDEEARIEREREERRRRQQAILQRHAQQQAVTETVVAPTATALAATAAVAPAAPESAAATPSRGAPRSPAPAAAGEGAAQLRHVASASGLNRSVPGTPLQQPADGGDGDRTPEGEATSSSEASDFNADGPVLDIFAQEQAAADDADSGAAAAAVAAAAEDAERERERRAAALLQQEPGASTELERVVGRGGEHGTKIVAKRRNSGVAEPTTALDEEQEAGNDDDDDDDMFAVDDSDAPAGAGALAAARAAPAAGAAQLHDSYDDAEGYYNFQIGEVLDGRYEVTEFKGKGVFSNVMRARDLGAGRGAGGTSGGGVAEVAIKVIRANETMYKAALTEQAILRKLSSTDPDNRKHCIRMLRSFEFRKHMCLVFEPMDMNLRDLTKKYGRNKGLNVTAVGMYTAQLLVALRHLRKNNVLHADIKPDNILVNARRTKVKICDFGSAMLAGENEVTPYLVSRFYRAPEVILGMKYEYPMDMWSVGCVVYELFTGNILFPGRTNNEMVKLMMDVKGPFTKKMLRRCAFADKHFDLNEPNAPFIYMEEDTLTKKPVRRMINVQNAKQPFSQLLAPAMRSAKAEDRPQIQLLVDLLEKMMMLEPEKRIDTDAAMRHPFVRAFLPKKHEHRHGQRQDD